MTERHTGEDRDLLTNAETPENLPEELFSLHLPGNLSDGFEGRMRLLQLRPNGLDGDSFLDVQALNLMPVHHVLLHVVALRP